MQFFKCPRCEDYGYETLATHSHCVCCDYSPDYEYIPSTDLAPRESGKNTNIAELIRIADSAQASNVNNKNCA